MNKFLLPILLFLTAAGLFAQDSLVSERREILKYGIDQEILDLIDQIKDEKSREFDDDLALIFAESGNAKIKQAICSYFRELESSRLEKQIIVFLENYDLENKDSVVEYLQYVKIFKLKSAEDAVGNILKDIDDKLVSAAVSTLGALNSQKYFEKIWEIYEDADSSDDLKIAVIKALGETGDTAHIDMLSEILENPDERKAFRWYACEALGKIADKSSLDLFMTVWNENDPNLKSFVLAALNNYQMSEVYHIFEEALRDQNWRVRQDAEKALAKAKYAPALDILQYKAKKDPEVPVRLNAVLAIAEIGGADAYNFLREYAKDKANSESIRMTAIEKLGENDFSNSVSLFKELITDEWDKENSKVLDLACKQFSLYKSPGQADLFERMLGHKSLNLKIYALRAIGLNGVTSLRGKVEAFAEDSSSSSIKRIANDILDKL